MDILYTWTIRDILGYPEANQPNEFQINWSCVAKSEKNRSEFIGTVYQSPLDPYVEYDKLTEQLIWGLVNAKIDRAEIETYLAEDLAQKDGKPAVAIAPLPW